MCIKDLRLKCRLTQKEASQLLNISYKTYCRYETEESKYKDSLKYQKIIDILADRCKIDETHGKLTIQEIKEASKEIFIKYDISYCYLFGSYAKQKETELSDIDLLIEGKVKGLDYYGLLQELMDVLHKKVDLIKISNAVTNIDFLNEILKDGIKIYG